MTCYDLLRPGALAPPTGPLAALDPTLRLLAQHGAIPTAHPHGILIRRALAAQQPERASQLIEWLEQTVAGCNPHPTPFVWNGPRRPRRERARLRRLGGSGAAIRHGYSIAT